MKDNPKSDENFLSVKREKEGLVYRGPIRVWQKDIYGFYVRGLGDLWYITLRTIILTNDKSDWAYKAFYHALYWMSKGKRWPDQLNNEYQAKNRIQWWWSRLLFRFKDTKKYRPQKTMTRDPWIMLYCCAVHLGIDPCELPYPQWWLYRPHVWQWIRHLKGRTNIYPLLERLIPYPKKDYVIILRDYMKRYA